MVRVRKPSQPSIEPTREEVVKRGVSREVKSPKKVPRLWVEGGASKSAKPLAFEPLPHRTKLRQSGDQNRGIRGGRFECGLLKACRDKQESTRLERDPGAFQGSLQTGDD